MLINPTFRPFSTGNVSRTKKEATRTVSLIYIFYSISEERYRTLLHCLRQVKDIVKDSFTDFALNRAFICKCENLNITSSGIYIFKGLVCALLSCCGLLIGRIVIFTTVPGSSRQLLVLPVQASFCFRLRLQFTFMIPVFDGIACVNCVIYLKSRNVFNEWLRKLIVLCCCCQGWNLEAGG